jgi:hypothetical protein
MVLLLADGFSLTHQNVRFPKLVKDFLGVIPFLRRGSGLLTRFFSTSDLEQ